VRGVVKWALLFVGGGIGAMARIALATVVQTRVGSAFPWGVLAVNWVGCLAIGALVAAADERRVLSPGARELLVAGVLGGFTTFSAFGFDTWQLMSEGHVAAAVANVLASVIGGVVAVALGVQLVRALT
jgi:CrcB protein